MTDLGDVVARVHREEWARVVATLARRFGSLDIAEEATADAFATAVERWPTDGVPARPGAWLTTTATRKAIDRLRREARRDEKHKEAMVLTAGRASHGVIDDDRLRLIFVCCHPAIALEARVALTLRMVGGLTVPEIARAFLVQDAAMGQRITRAKAKISAAKIPFRVPSGEDLPARVAAVLLVLYLIFNEGFLPSDPGRGAVRSDLTDEAIRLTRLVSQLLPADGEVVGLLALMLLIEARRPARVPADDALVALDDQDRSAWDRGLIEEGHALVRRRLASGEAPGRFQVLAAINAVHTDAASFADTDWAQVVALYDQLAALDPSPLVLLNRAVAVGELFGPTVALAEVDRLDLARLDVYYATRAHLLARLGRLGEARTAYDLAIECTANPAARAHLAGRRDRLGPG